MRHYSGYLKSGNFTGLKLMTTVLAFTSKFKSTHMCCVQQVILYSFIFIWLFTRRRSFSGVTLIRNTIRHEWAKRRFCSPSHVRIENAAHDSRSYILKNKNNNNASFFFGFNVFRGWCYITRLAFKDRCLTLHWASFHITISQRDSCSFLWD